MSRYLRAVKRIATANPDLAAKVLPFMDEETETIFFDEIYAQDLSGGVSAAVAWIQALWTASSDGLRSDPFNRMYAMDEDLRTATVDALAILLEVRPPSDMRMGGER